MCMRSYTLILLSVLWFSTCAVIFSNVGFNILFFMLAIYAAMSWIAIWLIRLGISLWKKRRGKDTEPSFLYWMLEPTVIIFSLTLAYSGIFSFIRFSLSEQSLSRYVEQVRTGTIDLSFEFDHPERKVGLYTIAFTDHLSDGTVRVITSSHGVLDKAGFANSTSDPPPKQGESAYQHIHQHWWYWYESW